jgi:plasmid replication initiation protein
MKMEDPRRDGLDELNICELPIALISERVPSGVTSLVFENQFGKLTVRGAEGLGLPTSGDTDVIVGLMQLTREKNGFTSATVPFTRYELLRLLGRADKSQHYKRLDESLNRWMGVTLIYTGSWFDNTVKRRVDAKFHILESVVIYDQETRKAIRQSQPNLPFSTFTWNQVFFANCLSGNLKRLDTATYFGLKSAIAKNAYRYLDKRLYTQADLTMPLRVFAFEHVGLSRGYTDARLRQLLRPALDELISVGVIKSAEFVSKRRGEWSIRVVAGNLGRGNGGADVNVY